MDPVQKPQDLFNPEIENLVASTINDSDYGHQQAYKVLQEQFARLNHQHENLLMKVEKDVINNAEEPSSKPNVQSDIFTIRDLSKTEKLRAGKMAAKAMLNKQAHAKLISKACALKECFRLLEMEPGTESDDSDTDEDDYADCNDVNNYARASTSNRSGLNKLPPELQNIFSKDGAPEDDLHTTQRYSKSKGKGTGISLGKNSNLLLSGKQPSISVSTPSLYKIQKFNMDQNRTFKDFIATLISHPSVEPMNDIQRAQILEQHLEFSLKCVFDALQGNQIGFTAIVRHLNEHIEAQKGFDEDALNEVRAMRYSRHKSTCNGEISLIFEYFWAIRGKVYGILKDPTIADPKVVDIFFNTIDDQIKQEIWSIAKSISQGDYHRKIEMDDVLRSLRYYEDKLKMNRQGFHKEAETQSTVATTNYQVRQTVPQQNQSSGSSNSTYQPSQEQYPLLSRNYKPNYNKNEQPNTAQNRDSNKFKSFLPRDQYDKLFAKWEKRNRTISCTECGQTTHNYYDCPIAIKKQHPCIFCSEKHFGKCELSASFHKERMRLTKSQGYRGGHNQGNRGNYQNQNKSTSQDRNHYQQNNTNNKFNGKLFQNSQQFRLPLQNRYSVLDGYQDGLDTVYGNTASLNEPGCANKHYYHNKYRNNKSKKNTKTNRMVGQFKALNNPKHYKDLHIRLMNNLTTRAKEEQKCYNEGCFEVPHVHSTELDSDRVIASLQEELDDEGKTYHTKLPADMKYLGQPPDSDDWFGSTEVKYPINTKTESDDDSQTDDFKLVLPPQLQKVFDEIDANREDSNNNNSKPEVFHPNNRTYWSFSVKKQTSSNFLAAAMYITDKSMEKFIGIFDSGAEASIINYAVAQKLGLELKDSEIRVKGIGKNSIAHQAKLTSISITIEGLIFPKHDFLVLPDMDCPSEIIIGREFMCKNRCWLDMARKTIKFRAPTNIMPSTVYTLFLEHGPGEGLLAFEGLPVYAESDLNPPKEGVYPVEVFMQTCIDSRIAKETSDVYGSETLYYLDLDPAVCRFSLNGMLDLKAKQTLNIFSDGDTIEKGQLLGVVYTAFHVVDQNIVKIARADTGIGQESLHIDEQASLLPPRDMTNFESDHIEHMTKNPNMEGPIGGTEVWSLSKLKSVFDIDYSVLTPDQVTRLYTLLYKYREAFTLNEDDCAIGTVAEVAFRIKEGAQPQAARPRRLPHTVNEAIGSQIDKYLKSKVLENSNSSWAANVHLVHRKGHDKPRLVVDYRKLNDELFADRQYLTSTFDRILQIGAQEYMSSFDLKSAYHLLRLREGETRDLTSIITPQGLFRFTCLPFGVHSSVAIFSKVMDFLFAKISREALTKYMDDLLIHSKTIDSHFQSIENFLWLVIRHRMKLAPEKSKLFRTQIEFLGMVISKNGIEKSPSHTERIMQTEKPLNGRQMRTFIGVCQYQRAWIPNCSKILEPLNRAINHKKPSEKIIWTKEMEDSFELIKKELQSDLKLAFPDYQSDQPLVLYCDASAHSVGSSLTQIQNGHLRVITHASSTLSKAERRYSTIDRELLGLIYAVKSHRHFLLGSAQPFVIKTDHLPLVWLFRSRSASPRLYRAMCDLEEMNFTVSYVKGNLNLLGDFFSRNVKPLSKLENQPDDSEVRDSPFVPQNMAVRKIDGGGDSYFITVCKSLSRLEKQTLGIDSNCEISSLRKLLVDEIIANPKRYGLYGDRDELHNVKTVLSTDTVPTMETIMATAQILNRDIVLYIGIKHPIIFHPFSSSKKKQADMNEPIYIQALASGAHYNQLVPFGEIENKEIASIWLEDENVTEYQDEDPKFILQSRIIEDCETDINIRETPVRQEAIKDKVITLYEDYNPCGCQISKEHKRSDFLIKVGDEFICVIIDTGAAMSMISRSAVTALRSGNAKIVNLKDRNPIDILAFDKSTMTPLGKIQVSLPINCAEEGVFYPVYVLQNEDMGTSCMLWGAGYLVQERIILDFSDAGPDCKINSENQCCLVIRQAGNIDAIMGDQNIAKRCKGTLLKVSDALDLQSSHKALKSLRRNFQREKYPGELQNYRIYKKHFSLSEEGILLMKNSIVVTNTVLISVACSLHDNYGHIGRMKLMDLLHRARIWAPRIQEVVSDLLRSCCLCQCSKVFGTMPRAPVHKVRVRSCFDVIHSDVLKLPKTPDNHIGIVVFICHKSKWIQSYPIKDTKAETILEIFKTRYLISIPKTPLVLFTDQGTEFCNKDMEDFLKRRSIAHMTSPSRTPHCNGVVEIANASILKQLRSFALQRPNDWLQWIPQVVTNMNHTICETTGRSPSSSIYKHAHEIEVDNLLPPEIRDTWTIGNPRFAPYTIGTQVLLKQKFQGNLLTNKMSNRYKGIYEVKEVYSGGVLYDLQHLDGTYRNKVHYNDLRTFIRPPQPFLELISFQEYYKKWWLKSFKTLDYSNLQQLEGEPQVPVPHLQYYQEEAIDDSGQPYTYEMDKYQHQPVQLLDEFGDPLQMEWRRSDQSPQFENFFSEDETSEENMIITYNNPTNTVCSRSHLSRDLLEDILRKSPHINDAQISDINSYMHESVRGTSKNHLCKDPWNWINSPGIEHKRKQQKIRKDHEWISKFTKDKSNIQNKIITNNKFSHLEKQKNKSSKVKFKNKNILSQSIQSAEQLELLDSTDSYSDDSFLSVGNIGQDPMAVGKFFDQINERGSRRNSSRRLEVFETMGRDHSENILGQSELGMTSIFDGRKSQWDNIVKDITNIVLQPISISKPNNEIHICPNSFSPINTTDQIGDTSLRYKTHSPKVYQNTRSKRYLPAQKPLFD